jgi:hypothetical protein
MVIVNGNWTSCNPLEKSFIAHPTEYTRETLPFDSPIFSKNGERIQEMRRERMETLMPSTLV